MIPQFRIPRNRYLEFLKQVLMSFNFEKLSQEAIEVPTVSSSSAPLTRRPGARASLCLSSGALCELPELIIKNFLIHSNKGNY